MELILKASTRAQAVKLANLILMASEDLFDSGADETTVSIATASKKPAALPPAKTNVKTKKPEPVVEDTDTEESDDSAELDSDTDSDEPFSDLFGDSEETDSEDSDSDVEPVTPPPAKKGPGRPPKQEASAPAKQATKVDGNAKPGGSKAPAKGSAVDFASLKGKLKQLGQWADGNSRGKDLLTKIGAKTLVDVPEEKYGRLNEGLDKLIAELSKKKKAA